jgi:hypothetical protein
MKACSFLALIGAAVGAHAALPQIVSVQADSVFAGQAVTCRVQVTDVDGDLDFVRFSVASPGPAGWQTLGDVEVNGSSAAAVKTWTPQRVGVHTVRAVVYDLSGQAAAERTFDVIAGRLRLGAFTAPAGSNRLVTHPGEITMIERAGSAAIEAQPAANLIFWSGGRVVLRSGFRARAGAFFWGAVDHDLDGYSDLEELADTDGDGMFDAWEFDHGFNLLDPSDAAGDADGDGLSNLAEFQSHRDPRNRDDAPGLPAGVGLVLRVPGNSFFGVKLSTWEILPVAAP